MDAIHKTGVMEEQTEPQIITIECCPEQGTMDHGPSF